MQFYRNPQADAFYMIGDINACVIMQRESYLIQVSTFPLIPEETTVLKIREAEFRKHLKIGTEKNINMVSEAITAISLNKTKSYEQ
jgi:hypothetical protein